MDNDKDKVDKFKHKGMVAFHVAKMLGDIPKDLLDLFTPNNVEGLIQLEINIVRWMSRSPERTKVMRLQKQNNLPLRPNQSLREVSICLKILQLKKIMRMFSNNNDSDKLFPSDDE